MKYTDIRLSDIRDSVRSRQVARSMIQNPVNYVDPDRYRKRGKSVLLAGAERVYQSLISHTYTLATQENLQKRLNETSAREMTAFHKSEDKRKWCMNYLGLSTDDMTMDQCKMWISRLEHRMSVLATKHDAATA